MIDNKLHEALVILMEECAEVQVEASKLMRFGTDDLINFNKEIGDLVCMIELLHERGFIDEELVDKQTKVKREKLKKWSSLFDDENKSDDI